MSEDRDRNDAGRYVQRVAPDDVLELFDSDVVPGPVLTYSDVAGHFGVSKVTARDRMSTLAEQGLVESRTAGRTKLWWRVDTNQNEQRGSDTNNGESKQ